MPELSPHVKRRVKFVGRLAILLIVGWFVHRAAWTGWRQLQNVDHWSPARIRFGWLAAAAAFYSLGQLPCGLFWHRILAALGQHVPFSAVLRAFYIGHLGKYVPGKAMVVVMRAGMLVQAGARTGPAAVSVFFETLTMMAVGAAVSCVIILVRFPDKTQWLLAAAAMIVVTGLPTFPPVFERIVRRLRRGRIAETEASHEMRRVGVQTFVAGWALMTIAWIMHGLSVWATVHAAGFESGASLVDQWTVGTAAAALAVVVGFLSFIPGGFGVRDAVMLSVLTWSYDEATALVTAILVRLIWLVAELLVSVILYKSASGPRVAELAAAASQPADASDGPGG